MTVKEVIELAAQCLGREDLSEAVASLEGEPEGEVKALVRCFNLVENEVALDYFPLRKEETFTPQTRELPYLGFASAPVDILGVTDGAGRAVEFEARTMNIYLPAEYDKVTVTYSYAPAQKEIDGVSDFSGKVSARLLALGVAAEFCLTASRFSEAAMWDKRFRDALRAAGIIRRKLSMRSRRWV